MDKPRPSRWLGRILLWSAFFWIGLLLGFLLARLGRSPSGASPGTAPAASSEAVVITIAATIDGADRFSFTSTTASNLHMKWSAPREVFFNGTPWEDLSQPPPSWLEMSSGLDWGRAEILNRQGRDIIALEHKPDGFDVYFADTAPGAAPYQVTISIPRK